jgi:8-oxo-dGTP diphosphatase
MIRVTCAIIEIRNKVLVVQRSDKMKMPLKWEFPGGKIEINESEEDCIKREIKEELNIEIGTVCRLAPSVFHYPAISIQLIPFISKYLNGVIKLREHSQYLWLEKKDLLDLDWAEADLPIVKEYINL